jgi:hypothetical protein
MPGDLRAWDVVIRGRSRQGAWIRPVEAETAPRDFQALERRLELKMRDSDVDAMILLLADTRHNRDFIRVNRASLAIRFPVPGERALELLRVGAPPDGSALIVL